MKEQSPLFNYLRECGIDDSWAVLWAYVSTGTRYVRYLGAFLRHRDNLDPARVLKGKYRLVRRGRKYSFYALE